MARRLGIPRNSAKELIVLARKNDPFYKGTPAHIRDAEWFASLWERFGYHRVHRRRVHYNLVSQKLEFADGTPYENTERCWCRLCEATAAARIVGLVDVRVDVTIDHAVLTHDQCVDYELPRSPIKYADGRRSRFEAGYGEGATDLDALEALHPGTLAEIVRRAITPYVDRRLASRLAEAQEEAQRRIAAAWTGAAGHQIQEAARQLSEQASAVAAQHAERIQQIIEEALGELEQMANAGDQLQERGEQIAAGLNIELPPRPPPEIANPALLFDSRRHWLEQLAAFKARQRGQQ
jgi:hypothetical protein